MHCWQVLTFLLSPIEWLSFCQNSWTCHYFLMEKNWISTFWIPLFSGIAHECRREAVNYVWECRDQLTGVISAGENLFCGVWERVSTMCREQLTGVMSAGENLFCGVWERVSTKCRDQLTGVMSAGENLFCGVWERVSTKCRDQLTGVISAGESPKKLKVLPPSGLMATPLQLQSNRWWLRMLAIRVPSESSTNTDSSMSFRGVLDAL